MSVVREFLRLFNLRRGELRLAGLMMIFRFAAGFTFITAQNVAITLFLSRFEGSLFGFQVMLGSAADIGSV